MCCCDWSFLQEVCRYKLSLHEIIIQHGRAMLKMQQGIVGSFVTVMLMK